AGDIRKGLMYEIMPFDNEIVIVRVKGDKVLSLMKRIAEQGGVPVSRGIQMVIEKQKMASLLVNGEAVDPNKDYLIAVNDFMATGGDGFEELTAGDHILTGILVRDALTNHFLMMQAKGQSITARIEKRIVD
ncbi:MAG: 5'-nucleotidase, partial [Saprospiraceae bacterium]